MAPIKKKTTKSHKREVSQQWFTYFPKVCCVFSAKITNIWRLAECIGAETKESTHTMIKQKTADTK